MTLLLEELGNLGIDVKLMTLPLLYPYNAVATKKIEDFNDWLRRLHSNYFKRQLIQFFLILNSSLTSGS